MSNFLCPISKQSAVRFIRLCLSLDDTPYWYHQSFSFGRQIEDSREAKDHLDTFFDSWDKEMKKEGLAMAALYIMGRQQNSRVHFHLVLFTYPPLSLGVEQLEIKLRRIVWPRWEKLSEGAIQQANRLTRPAKAGALRYLLQEHFKVETTKRERGKPLWYGCRNRDLIRTHSTPPDPRQVRQTLGDLFPQFSDFWRRLNRPEKRRKSSALDTL
jgi:hypothetical protein